MKKTLLRLFSMAMAVSFANLSQAQDLGLRSMTPSSETELKAGTTRNASVAFNVAQALPANTSFSLSYSIDGGTPVVVQQSLTFQNAVPVDANINPVGFTFDVPSTVDDTFEMKVFIDMASDADRSNDTITSTFYTREKVANDISVAITSPPANSDQKTWTTVPFTLSITNEGTNTFNSGTPIILILTVNGQAQGGGQAINYQGSNIAPGESGSVTLNLNLARNAATGTATFCLGYFWAELNGTSLSSIDGNSTDNIGCVTLNVIQNSIDETKAGLNALTYSNGGLNIELDNRANTQQYRFEVISVTGQQVASETTAGDFYLRHRMPLNYVQNGMYILNIYADDEFIGSEKFMVR